MIRLRETGMPIAEVRRFAELRSRGDATVPERLAMLREHSAGLRERIRVLRRNASALDDKIDHYERLRARPGSDDRT
ncbi:MerR family DNA-binding protein [Streptomyces sp. NPDC002667]|uniref:MerR family DNA-binding protein n=1 Tax=Streptomyces sp. NPDC002667 TaxID=3364657 RepID=UPI0036918F2C